jgi:hypothetical protein
MMNEHDKAVIEKSYALQKIWILFDEAEANIKIKAPSVAEFMERKREFIEAVAARREAGEQGDAREIARAIEDDEQYEGIRLQWVRCEEDDPPNGGVLFVRNADKGLLVNVNGARYTEPHPAEAVVREMEIGINRVRAAWETIQCAAPETLYDRMVQLGKVIRETEGLARRHGLEVG